jgi:hypothetical protein
MQFISADPALSDAEESAYQYCGGDPVGKTDPSGLWSANVHYGETFLLAMSEGLGYLASRVISYGDVLIDSRYPSKRNGKVVKKNLKYHSNLSDSGQARRFLNEAVYFYFRGWQWTAWLRLGGALHCEQDYIAHGGPLKGGAADNWGRSAALRNRTRQKTRDILHRFRWMRFGL